MDLAFWVAIVRLVAYGVLSPACLVLGMDRYNRACRYPGGLYSCLGIFFLAVLIANVLDLLGERDAVRVARMLVVFPAVAAAGFSVLCVARGRRE